MYTINMFFLTDKNKCDDEVGLVCNPNNSHGGFMRESCAHFHETCETYHKDMFL